MNSKEPQLAGVEGSHEFFEKETTEEPREIPNGQKEAGPAGDSAHTVQREASSRGDHVKVRMVRQRRTPGMENGYRADAGAQVFGISGVRDQRFGRRLEPDVVDRRLVVIGDVGDGRRQREHEVIIGNGQQFGFALGEPGSGCRVAEPGSRAAAWTARWSCRALIGFTGFDPETAKPAGARRPPPIAEQLEQLRREHNEAILLPHALLDPQRHELAVDIGFNATTSDTRRPAP